MGWATKLLLAENCSPSSKRTMILAVPWGFPKAPLIPVWSLYFKLINNFKKHEKFNNFI
jgi:hypothetical protein